MAEWLLAGVEVWGDDEVGWRQDAYVALSRSLKQLQEEALDLLVVRLLGLERVAALDSADVDA